MRETAGPFIVSLFTAPDVLAVGPADISAMVEEKASGRVLLDADVVITLTAEDAAGTLITAHLSHAHATNQLLEDAVVDLPHAGRWRAVLQVHEGDRTAEAVTELTVAHHSSRRGTIWLFAMLPLLGIGVFAWAHAEKRLRRTRVLRAA